MKSNRQMGTLASALNGRATKGKPRNFVCGVYKNYASTNLTVWSDARARIEKYAFDHCAGQTHIGIPSATRRACKAMGAVSIGFTCRWLARHDQPAPTALAHQRVSNACLRHPAQRESTKRATSTCTE